MYPEMSPLGWMPGAGARNRPPNAENRVNTAVTARLGGAPVVGRVHGLSPLVPTGRMVVRDTRSPPERRTRTMTTLDHNGSPKSAQSPFFIAAIGMMVALVAIAGAVAVLS